MNTPDENTQPEVAAETTDGFTPIDPPQPPPLDDEERTATLYPVILTESLFGRVESIGRGILCSGRPVALIQFGEKTNYGTIQAEFPFTQQGLQKLGEVFGEAVEVTVTIRRR